MRTCQMWRTRTPPARTMAVLLTGRKRRLTAALLRRCGKVVGCAPSLFSRMNAKLYVEILETCKYTILVCCNLTQTETCKLDLLEASGCFLLGN